MKLDWLDEGSLIILLPEPLLSEWHGTHSDDYDRACAISNSWFDTISVTGGHGFLLGDDVGMVLAIPNVNGVTSLIRWVYANDEDELVAFALEGKSVTHSEPTFVFNNTFAKWVLFNAAASPSLDNPTIRVIGLPLGQIRVETDYCESKPNAAIVHRFSKSAQHSVHPTGGSLRVFKQFVWLGVGSGKAALSRLAHQRVTPTVGRLSCKTKEM